MASTSSLGAQSTTSTQEAQDFYNSFNLRLRDLKQRTQDATEVGELRSIFEEISKARTALTEKTDQLPKYDRQLHEQHLKDVNGLLTIKRVQLAPKPKFAFKRSTKAKEAPPPLIPVPVKSSDVNDIVQASSPPSPPLSIRDKTGEVLNVSSLPASDHATDLHLLNLQDCIVDLRDIAERPKFLALQVRNLRRCVVLCGSIEGSTMVHNCDNTLIVLQCRQFRMHSSDHMAILIATSSVATLEHCTNVTLAPLMNSQALPSVQDFDHISTLESSSNWSVMEDEVYKAIQQNLDLNPLLDVDTLLQSAGLASK